MSGEYCLQCGESRAAVKREGLYCAGCGTDDGNWNQWPCPTVRAIQTELEQKETQA